MILLLLLLKYCKVNNFSLIMNYININKISLLTSIAFCYLYILEQYKHIYLVKIIQWYVLTALMKYNETTDNKICNESGQRRVYLIYPNVCYVRIII